MTIKQVENGFVLTYGTITSPKTRIFTCLGELICFITNYFNDDNRELTE